MPSSTGLAATHLRPGSWQDALFRLWRKFPVQVVYRPPKFALRESGFDFCPGCGYGSILLALTECVATLPERPVFMLDIGCVDFMVAHMPGDVMMGTHGRTSAFASGYKRVHPERIVIAIQGDGGFMGHGATESLP